MAFLAELVAKLLEWVTTTLFVFAKKQITQAEADKAIDDKAKAEAQALKDAQTDEERDKASKDVISGL